MMKLKIREQSIKYATAKKVKMFRREGELEKEINFLQNFIESNETSPNEKNRDIWHSRSQETGTGKDY